MWLVCAEAQWSYWFFLTEKENWLLCELLEHNRTLSGLLSEPIRVVRGAITHSVWGECEQKFKVGLISADIRLIGAQVSIFFSRFFSFMSLIWFLTVIKILSAENKNSLLWILILRCCPRQSQFQLSGNETQRQMEFLGVLAASQVNVSSLEEPLQALCQDRSVHWTRRTEGEGAALAQTSNVELKKVYNYSDKV